MARDGAARLGCQPQNCGGWGTAVLDGTALHYLRFDGEGSTPRPLVVTSGWPSSFWELTGLARRLAEPSRWGGDSGDAFTVIIPCLPGFPLTDQLPELPARPAHELWHRLMRDELGFAATARTGATSARA